MKVIIAGSKGITDLCLVEAAYLACPFTADEIVSGGARGVDKLGEKYAKILGIPVKRFLADWDAFGKSAGYKRNILMSEYADACIAIWDRESKGTQHMINLMKKKNKPVYVYYGDT